MNIFLIGYRCSGKTSVGKAFAARMGWRFFDCDTELVKAAGRSIKQIVEDQGWNAFRDMERGVLTQVCRMDATVVATGGGVVLDAENIRDMKRSGVIIWLKAQPDTVKKRILADGKTEDYRPSLGDTSSFQEIEEVLKRRIPLYAAAMDVEIQTDDAAIDTICSRIHETLKKMNIEH